MIKMRSMHFVALVISFIIFSVVVGLGATISVDDSIMRYFKSIQGNPSIDLAMIVIASFGDVTTLFIFGVIITIIRRTRKVGMVFLIALVVVAVSVMYLKPLVGRASPPYSFRSAFPLPNNFTLESDSLEPMSAGLSYPSGHVSDATTVAFIIGYAIYRKSKPAGIAIWAFPIIAGVTRLYVMQHYTTDIIGGFLFGAIVSVILANTMKLDQPFLMSRFKGKEDAAPQQGDAFEH